MDQLKKCQGCSHQLPDYAGLGQPRKFCSDSCRTDTRNAARRTSKVRPSVEQRFRAKTKPVQSGCVEWMGAKNNAGYGNFRIGAKTVLAHRYAYELSHDLKLGAEQVLHACDNPPCVSAGHLFLGNHDDNMADRDAKGRTLQGERGRHKYTLETIEAIRKMLAHGASHRVISEATGVSKTHISYIRNGMTRRNE